jgi:uncharacterized SAM-binding protein YcdF (DUF218 family)
VFLLPFNVCLFLLTVGVLFLLITRKQKIARIILMTGVLVLLILSTPPVATQLVNSLGREYHVPDSATLMGPNIRWIVVLGGGHNSSNPAGQQLSMSSLARVVEGIRIFRLKAGRTLILSGGSVYDPVPNARAMAEEASALGLDQKDIILESQSRDTEEEAVLLAPILKQDRFFLVTTAMHMPRAIAIFVKQGMNPIAAPCDFSFSPQNPPILLRVLPNGASFQQSERAFHEYLGMIYSRIRGKA